MRDLRYALRSVARARGFAFAVILTLGPARENIEFSVPEINDFRSAAKTLGGIAEYSRTTFNLVGERDAVRIDVGLVTGNYFDVIGLSPVLGFALALAVLVAVLLSFAPTLARENALGAALSSGAKRATGGVRRQRLQQRASHRAGSTHSWSLRLGSSR